MTRVDLAVVGGGPVGLGAAIAGARAGMEVLVFEPREGVIDKACGEGILPGGLVTLAELGVARLAGCPLRGVRYSDARDPGRSASAEFPAGPGLGVRRSALHARLRQRAAELGVAFRAERVREVEPRDDDVRIDDVRARYAIAADGLHSPTRARLGLELPSRHPPRFGVRRHFAVRPWSDHVEIHLARGAEAYVTPVGPELVGVAILFEGRGAFESLLARFPAIVERLAGAEAVTPVRGAGPFEQRVRVRVAGRVLLAGDAAGYVDPLTGEGVALGLATAVAAVECLRAGRPEAYEAAWCAITRRAFALTAGLLALVRRPALHRPLIAAAHMFPAAMTAALAELQGAGFPAGIPGLTAEANLVGRRGAQRHRDRMLARHP